MPKISKIRFRGKLASTQAMSGRETKKSRVDLATTNIPIDSDDDSVAAAFPFNSIPAPSRKRRSDLGSKHKVASFANQAATKYGAKYLSELRFLRCGCCLREDSSSKFVELAKAKDASYLNYLQKMKTYYMGHLRRLESTDYDKTFANAYEDFLDEDGIFGNSRYICLECYKDLRKVT